MQMRSPKWDIRDDACKSIKESFSELIALIDGMKIAKSYYRDIHQSLEDLLYNKKRIGINPSTQK